MRLDRRTLLGAGGALAAGTLLRGPAAAGATPPLNAGLTGYLTGLHDPVIIREGETYHVFGSGGWNGRPGPSWRISRDLKTWTDNGMPFGIPDWAKRAIPQAESVWAPDIHFVDGLYRLYYSVSTGGSMRSVTGLATSPTLDRHAPGYGWTDHGLVVETAPGSGYNAIDSNFFRDADGQDWLLFGSYWGGLKLIALDRATGKRRAGDTALHALAYRPAPEGADNPIEGGFLFRHQDYVYLFASFDYCCRKLASNYYVAAGRARSVLGPFVDKKGRSMMDGYAETVLIERPWGGTRWRGPGHCGLMHDGARDLIVYHAYDAEHDAAPTLRLAVLSWDAEGWPVALS
ncbi:arabinan endo-1,5-alpha-L-arabinosidase [Sphingomonas morindae]|uniref:Extracellular exo-alpha-(1->5)-L-arabinofuranosidase n=1 Tax=Sphingomonas morindae TaxID=1541170 RepID=A0ABY4XDC1_9SPHN|nr:arabinan endo-1,5-alpha-L-arabinosidase [Sphingomonas morindae]USI74971.1 arabinan endo-1,5-alpha-L-arabinosidase [Sphingomonas morindae]